MFTLSPQIYVRTVSFKCIPALLPSNQNAQCSLKSLPVSPQIFDHNVLSKLCPYLRRQSYLISVCTAVLKSMSTLFSSNLCPHYSSQMRVCNVHSNLNPNCSLQVYVHTVTSDLCSHCFPQIYVHTTPLN